MRLRILLLKSMHWLPPIVYWARVLVFVLWRKSIPLYQVQWASLLFAVVISFRQWKLFKDAVPTGSTILLDAIHLGLVYLFLGELPILRLLPILILDGATLLVFAVKVSRYPYEISLGG